MSRQGKHFANKKEMHKSAHVQNQKKTSKKAQTSKKSRKFPLFRILSLLIIIACVIYIVIWYRENNKTEKIMEVVYEEAVVDKEDGKSEIDFNKLKELNSDVVGWIKVNNTNVDYPVVKGRDNSFYLNHSLDKSYNAAGWPFVDYQTKLDGTDENIVIYGHNRQDGPMFGSLEDILKPEWYNNEENLYITYTTEEGEELYQVFSIYNIKRELYYTTNNFTSDDEYVEFLNELESRSIVDFNVDLDKDDSILTLSTCADHNVYRNVLHAKKVN